MLSLHSLSERLGVLRGFRRPLAASALGALAAAAMAPLHLVFVLPVSFAALVWLLDGARTWRRAAFDGWSFGLGFFLAGLYWIGHAFLVEAGRFGWMMPFALLGLAACLAVYPGLAAVLYRLSAPLGAARALVLAAAWTPAEWLRGELLTGFPWNALGYAWAFSDQMIQVVSLIGTLGLGLITVAAAASFAQIAERGAAWRRWGPPGLAVLVVAALWSWGFARLPDGAAPIDDRVRLRIVQANIPQSIKWHPDHRRSNFLRHIELATAPAKVPPNLIILPETAVPYFLGREARLRSVLGATLADGGMVLTGAPRLEQPHSDGSALFNSVLAIDPQGRVVATYDKAHLVPFGEYLPLRGLLAIFGIDKLAHGATDFSAGSGARSLSLPGLPTFAPLICYEVIFAAEVVDAHDPPAWLLNLTNDAWFGRSSGPYQHFAMARLRAVERGIPLVRAAGGGISAIVDPWGRVVARLGLGIAGTLDGRLPLPLRDRTIYDTYGDGPVLVVALLLLLGGLIWRRTKPAHTG